MRVLFMGTPEFAAASLKAVHEAGHEICAVITQPDKKRNRGMKFSAPPVKAYAESCGLSVYQPEGVRSESALDLIRSLNPDILTVVAYGRILPPEMLSVAKYGAINVHASLLPKYRGSAPIQWALLNGERVTGVATMYLAEEMDAGDIIDAAETEVGEYETFGELYDKLKEMGAKLLVKTLADIENGTAARAVQDTGYVTFAPPIKKADCGILWRTADEAVNKARAFDPKPGAFADINGKSYKVFSIRKTDEKSQAPAGSVVSSGAEGIGVACSSGEVVKILEIQAPGSKRMSAGDYLRGRSL